ncbi:imidazole glycerol phosphate synthase subunit HisF [Mesonia aquimarina]|uniref:imidazole glycerol phosphate synthase subunit HisF n=1 Tax=Mesonia aquimarina TaxID=1504967 RepID=UPI000EF5A363|nr:imidazole glycerol phosphate synthase subunit HisF [Mesonia aquimarina]
MLSKRIIPCLDIKNGRTVKGVRFQELRDAGDPIELAEFYTKNGADELVFLDISASEEKRATLASLVEQIAAAINIPFTVGGGISSIQDVQSLLKNGADKVSINSAAIQNPELIKHLADKFGSQCIVVAIDAKQINGEWWVYSLGGKIKTSLNLYKWAQQVQQLGAGEILFTSMNHDGTKNGFANEALQQLSKKVSIPVIASGGAGTREHFLEVFQNGKADAALAASVFHFKEIDLPNLKSYLQENKITIR